jgi:hypothetical protein
MANTKEVRKQIASIKSTQKNYFGHGNGSRKQN